MSDPARNDASGTAPATPSPASDTRPGWHIAVLLLVPLLVVIALELLHVPEILRGLIMK